MADLIIVPDQLTFPWRERTRICPRCNGKGGAPWLVDLKKRPDIKQAPKKLLPCLACSGKGELPVND